MGIDINVDMDIDPEMGASLNWGPCPLKRGFRAPV